MVNGSQHQSCLAFTGLSHKAPGAHEMTNPVPAGVRDATGWAAGRFPRTRWFAFAQPEAVKYRVDRAFLKR